MAGLIPATVYAHDPLTRDERLAEREEALAKVGESAQAAMRTEPKDEVAALGSALFLKPWLWEPGQDLSICFWNGSEASRDAFAKIAEAWSRHANLQLQFRLSGKFEECADGSTHDIRVSLDMTDGRDLWSDAALPKHHPYGRLGNTRKDPKPKVTLNIPLAKLDMEDKPEHFKFHVLHEMGHVWGLLHEHQRGICDKWYNEDEIAKDNGLTIQQVRNRFEKIPGVLAYDIHPEGAYDKFSIMQYNMKQTWFKAEPGNPCMRLPIHDLSDGDKKGVARIYGKPVVPAGATLSGGAAVQQTLARLAANAEKAAAAKEALSIATVNSSDVAIQHASQPRKECISAGLGGRVACFDKPLESVQLRAIIDRHESRASEAHNDAANARTDAGRLRQLQQAHEHLMSLQ
jgi:hypothetical protein